MQLAFAAAALAALVDWYAVARDHRQVEVVAKPATLVALLAAAIVLEPADATQRGLFLAALAASLVGDVFLLLDERWFVAGLASFLLAHLAYVAGFLAAGVVVGGVLAGVAVVAVVALGIGRRVVGGAPRELRPAVVAYVAVISTMVATALGSRDALAVAGAVSFYVSDALIGWTRFVGDVPHGRVAVMVTYHVGQGLLVASLLA